MENDFKSWRNSNLYRYLAYFYKIAGVVLFLFLYPVNSSSAVSVSFQAAKISVYGKNVQLRSVLDEIEKESGYIFVYNSQVDAKRNVSVDIQGKSISEALDLLFSGSDIAYSIEGKHVILNKREVNNSKSVNQKQKVRGTVEDAEGLPVIGANILIVGSTVGTVTDMNGAFEIEVSGGDVLRVSYLGYESKEVKIGKQKMINIILESDSKLLDEVVVVGYGTQKKVNLTGAVSSVSNKTFEGKSIANATQALQGQMANVGITMSSGAPGGQGNINVRGFTTINEGGEPLVLIDGVPGNINDINPNDIESVSVLKDAASAAVYGARAAFGVVLVTTKGANDEKFSVTYNGYVTVSSPTMSTDFVTNGYEQVSLVDEAFMRTLGRTYTGYTDEDMHELYIRRNDVVENIERPWTVVKNVGGRMIYNYYGNYDWWDTFFDNNALSHQHNVSVSGKTGKAKFSLSGNYYYKEGLWKRKTDKYEAYNLRAKVDVQVFPWLKIWNNTSLNVNEKTYPGLGDDANFRQSEYHGLAAYAPFNPDGTPTYSTTKNNYTIGDGVFALMATNAGGTERRYQITSTTGATIDLPWNVKLNLDYTFAPYFANNDTRTQKAYYSVEPGVMELVSQYPTDRFTNTNHMLPYNVANAYAEWEQTFKKHTVKVMGGVNYEHKQYYLLTGSRDDLTSTTLNAVNLGTSNQQASGDRYAYTLFGVFGRANYNYDDRYLVEVDARYDGTSRFKAGQRFGFFPSVSAAWRASEEEFWEPIKDIVSNFKLRASYGSLGNQNVGTYAYIPSMATQQGSWISAGDKLLYYSAPGAVSENLTWEKIYTTNIGIDLGLLGNRLGITADIYQRDTKDMLVPGVVLPSVFGTSSPKQNLGELRTRGYEISVAWNDRFMLAGKPFHYNISATLGDNISKITKYDNPTKSLTDYYEGMTIGEIWGYSVNIFQSDEEAAEYTSIVDQDLVNQKLLQSPTAEWNHYRAGDIKFHDLNGDNVIDYGKNTVDDPGDKKIIGNSQPRWNYGFTIGGDWNGIDFNCFFQGIGRRDVYPDHENFTFWGILARPYGTFLPKDRRADAYWSEDNPDAYFPVMRAYMALDDGGPLKQKTDRYVQNAGYLRLKNVVLGYTLPVKFTRKFHCERLRIYVSGDNLWTYTPIHSKYIDPETFNVSAHGVNYPNINKNFTVGIDIKF